jgi:aldehyde:ferredoxin oxidoreductase
MTEAAKTGPGKGSVSGLDKMLPEYYELRGWDHDGMLKTDTRTRLGL